MDQAIPVDHLRIEAGSQTHQNLPLFECDEAQRLVVHLVDFAPAGTLCVACDGTHWATIPVTQDLGGLGHTTLTCSLPAGQDGRDIHIELRDPATQGLIAAGTVVLGRAPRNYHGLRADQVFDPHTFPMFSVPWVSFNGEDLVVSGAHLPPQGDPANLSVRFGEGVAGTFEYPLPSPDFGAHYWYWPNSALSGFRAVINLPRTASDSDPFSFQFVSRTDKVERQAQLAHGANADWLDRSRIWIPNDLQSYLGFPPLGTQLTRVQSWSDHRNVAFTGYNNFKLFESLLAHHGVSHRPGLRLLDWGCGHGRLTRHFLQNWPCAQISGADIDGENIAWCRQALPGAQFHEAPLRPPMPIRSQTFDVVIGLSVATHLTEDVQLEWIEEIRRVLVPGGLALISFGGAGSAAFASTHHSPDWWARWTEAGFDADLHDPALAGKIADPAYYRVTHQTAEYTRGKWSKIMDVIDIQTQAIGYQDMAIMRRR